MPNIGPMELIIVLVVALLVLGPKRLPEVGRSLGNGIREFKDSLTGEHDDHDELHLDVEDPPKAVTTAAATAPAPPPAATASAAPPAASAPDADKHS